MKAEEGSRTEDTEGKGGTRRFLGMWRAALGFDFNVRRQAARTRRLTYTRCILIQP
jgi:hypothetical protein